MEARNADSTNIRPLTKRTMQGEIYLRRAETQLQIEKVLLFDAPQILEMLSGSERRGEADYLLDETLVYLFREARRSGDENLFNQLYAELNRRIWKLFLKFRSRFHDQSDFEDFGQKTETAILRKLLDADSDRADFAQVQFGSFVISEAKSSWKQNLSMINKDKEFLDAPREDADETDANELENLADGDLSDEEKMIIREGLSKLSPDQQMVAVMLLDGFQIESVDENELTISKHLGVSSRTIRNRIKEMRSALADYKGAAKR